MTPRLTPLWAALPIALAGCGDDTVCGPGDQPTEAITGEVASMQISYDSFLSSPNNDCPTDGSPTSITIEARQQGTNRPLVFCLPRPESIDNTPIAVDDDTLIQVIDSFADVGGCLMSVDRSRPVSGTLTFEGFCDDGQNADGYALTFDATFPVTLSCTNDGGMSETAETLTLSGRTAVAAAQL